MMSVADEMEQGIDREAGHMLSRRSGQGNRKNNISATEMTRNFN